MSIARHHAEWLNLVEFSGPSLSVPVLQRAFPQGLDAHDPEHLKNLRLAYEEWQENQNRPAIHTAWIRFILTETLAFPEELITAGQTLPGGLQVQMAEFGETIRPDFAIINPAERQNGGKPRMLVQVLGPGLSLEKPLPGRRWKVSPATRMMELLHATEVPLGLLTNGEQWMLVFAPVGETTGFTSWYGNIWLEEQITLRAFRSLLCARRFFGVPDDEAVEALFIESSRDQQEVTDQLGLQVRKAVEVLVQTLDRIDRDQSGDLLTGMDPKLLYEAALTLMMRLVFLFSAEERAMLLLGDPLYDQFYAVSTLSAQLRETADHQGEEILERYHDAWGRLLATFRAVYGGVEHDAMRLPAYGGNLFDPDRYPFLEGRLPGTSWRKSPASPLPIDNRTVLHLLEALQFLQVKMPGGPVERRRLSFRALGIEEIGYVYESLLDHTAVRAPVNQPVLGLSGSKNKEPEITLSELQRMRERGEAQLVAFLTDKTGRSPAAIRKSIKKELEFEEVQRLRTACGNDEELLHDVLPFSGLLREDTFGHPLVIPGGGLYVTAGTDRRESGTHYTPRALTEPIVQHALEPLVFIGPAEGKSKEEWKLRTAGEILQLKLCDMAMGSGAFLVQTCRYLSERLVEAWEGVEERSRQKEVEIQESGIRNQKTDNERREGRDGGRQMPILITPEGEVSRGEPGETIIPSDPDERLAYARRLICDRCLYGVDKNPMAVDMAKLSLWLITMDKGRAFTFLDHALKVGDSLLGLHTLEQIERFHIAPEHADDKQITMWWRNITSELLRQALQKRKELESFVVNDVRDSQRKAELLADADAAMNRIRIVCDLLVGAAISSADGDSKRRNGAPHTSFEEKRKAAWGLLLKNYQRREILSAEEAVEALVVEASRLLNKGNHEGQPPRRPFHWPIEFPEVFANGSEKGFAVFLSNPPFQGGQKITGILGTDYRNHLVDHIANGQKGSADLCAYFFLRAGQLLRNDGGFGMLATNTIAQGDTREVGLDQLQKAGMTIPRAVSSQKWPGAANLEVAHVWVRNGSWSGEHLLDGKEVSGITSFLSAPGKVTGNPFRLAANADKSYIGSYVLGMGFVLSPDEAKDLIERDPRNGDVIFPYLNGEDLNSRPDQSPSRFVIDFSDWPLDRSAEGSWNNSTKQEQKIWLTNGQVPNDYPKHVAADFPDLLYIVEEKVRPERLKKNDKVAQKYWWRFLRGRPELHAALSGMDHVLVVARVSKYLSFALVSTNIVASEQVVFIVDASYGALASLQSSFHEIWVREYQSSLETRGRYTPSDCFETYPFSHTTTYKDHVGAELYEYRKEVMLIRREGLTDIYNHLHNPNEQTPDIMRLRDLHIDMDRAVASAYGWTDINLNHDFHHTDQGLRFTIHEAARREILDRLLTLNHERYAEEVAAGLHEKGKKSNTSKARKRTSEDFQGKQLRMGF